MSTVAFIGLGNMGGPMAINLAKAGHTVTAFDLSEKALAAVKAEGVNIAASAADAIAGAEAVISMLPAGQHVLAVYLDEETGILKQLNKGALVLDCSTIDADSARALAKAGAELGVGVMDAPVSGGVAAAQAGTLSFMCGGSAEDFERAKAILAGMGKNIFHAGDNGAGQVAKMCNNMLLAIHMIGTAEALQLGANNGLDPKVLSEIMLASSGRNWSLEVYNPYPGVQENSAASKGYQPGFMVDLMIKDLGLAMENSIDSKSSVPMGSLARSLYTAHGMAGNGQKDFSSILNLLRKPS
ncbi:3-hydroxyisobutyrate dehydrogenase [Litorivivens lipolytica]|uniref:3-hydroxyisobutyrate dehydrogenase n=1 Tax=Litorivivens lipolytica TaxID=1524264 RepID=A0A7W4W297_9GAMM|nr:3-hydroxyisobutyrate dehydrogenase [Litorivivens lipolytica]MBB3046120.1 3-hydroxyisobutyrate dehydrogenase [Litorivivens lipolytica]